MRFQPAKHRICILIIDSELLADVGELHIFPNIGIERFVGNNASIIQRRICDKPSIGPIGKFTLGRLRKLGIVLYPIHYGCVGVSNGMCRSGYKCVLRKSSHPRDQIRWIFDFVKYPVNDKQSSTCNVMVNAVPESWTYIRRVKVAVCSYQGISIQELFSALTRHSGISNLTARFSKDSPLSPVREHASLYVRRSSFVARQTADANRGPMRHL